MFPQLSGVHSTLVRGNICLFPRGVASGSLRSAGIVATDASVRQSMGQNRGFRRRRVKPAALVSFRTCVRPFTRRELTCCFFVRGSNVFSSMLVALALILSSLVVATPAAHAQAQTAGEITGQVLDPSKAAISNAAVTATNSATGAVRKAQTDSQGHYALTDLPVGTYSVTVEHEGFQQLNKPVSC